MSLEVEIHRMRFPLSDRDLISNFNIDILPNSFVSLLGPSGIGKSTLLRIIGGFELRYDGHVKLDGEPITQPRRDVQILFQDTRLLPWMTAIQNLRFALPSDALDQEPSLYGWLAAVGLQHRANSWPKSLSGGETARLALARAFVGSPKVLLLDEPFNGVDIRIRYALHRELEQSLKISPKTVLLVTHSIEDAILLSDKIYVAGRSPMSELQGFRIGSKRPRDLSDSSLIDLGAQLTRCLLQAGTVRKDES